MEMTLSIERLRSPRSSSPRRRHSPTFYCDSENNSGASTPFVSAPSSPSRASPSAYWASSEIGIESSTEVEQITVAVPFSWEEKPGTPKRGAEIRNSVDHLTALGFCFTAPTSPQHHQEMAQDNLQLQQDDDFEFSSARLSEADSSVSGFMMSPADELFFQGQILPLKLPPRLQQQSSSDSLSSPVRKFPIHSSNNTSPKRSMPQQSSRRSTLRFPEHDRIRSEAHRRTRSLSPLRFHNDKATVSAAGMEPPATKSVRKSLRELLHLPTAGKKKNSSQIFPNSRSSSKSSSSSSSSRSNSRNSTSSRGSPLSPYELHYGAAKNAKPSEQMRRTSFLPYKQGLLGCLSMNCVSMADLRQVSKSEMPRAR